MPESTEGQRARRAQGPTTDRGAQRRADLLAAARRVFERKGFIETRVGDIAAEAGVSHGTFYTYFDTKEAVFTECCHRVIEEMLASMAITIPSSNFHARVRDSVRRFVTAYRPHATMMGLMEQVGLFTPELRELRLDVRETFVSRTSRGIARMQAEGLADPGLDVAYTAEALGAMLEYVCYAWFSLDRAFDEERLVDTISAIWERTLAP